MKWNTDLKLQLDFIQETIPVTDKKYYEMLECLPPQALVKNAFLVGEPVRHNHKGEALYDCYAHKDKQGYFVGTITEKEFKTWLIPA